MNLLRLHLWREWREHRMALLMLVLVLPLVAWGVARVPPKAALGEPLIQSGAALTFVVVLLVTTGGELLGVDRRGNGLRWLERLPTGLSDAFLAKLLFLAITTMLAAVYGLGVARSIALLRGVEPRAIDWEPISFIAGVSLVLWTFACSAWTLRGGVAILAATCVLGLVGYPAWQVLSEGYEPSALELRAAGTLFFLGGLVSAMLAFLRGGRFGRGTGMATFLGLAPAVPLLAISTAWSFDHFERRERIDPYSAEFDIHDAWASEDGRTALVGCYMRNERWEDNLYHVLRVDLGTGAWERVGGRNARIEVLGGDVEQGPLAQETCVWVRSEEDPAAAQLLAASNAERMPPGEPAHHQNGWVTTPAGLGWLVSRGPFRQVPVLYDPFRHSSVPMHELDLSAGDEVFIGPELWLVRKGLDWFECSPDERELVAADWMNGVAIPGPMLPDGRMLALLLSRETLEYCLVDPTNRRVLPLHRGLEESTFSWGGFLSAYRHCSSVFHPGESVVLDTPDGRFLFDETSTSLRRVFGETWEDCLRSLPDGTMILIDEHERLVRQDLATDERTVLFPVPD